MHPRVVASPDGAYLAVLRDGRVSLFAMDSGRRVGSAEVVGDEVAFTGHHLVVHGHDAHSSLVTVLALPALTVSASHEVPAATRLMAATSNYALLDRGDQALMLHCGRTAAVSGLMPPAAFTHAVGLEGPQFVTFGPRGAELWDAASRRPEARLRLELPADTHALGVANRHAQLWAVTGQPCLHLARISDGRVSTLWLDATPRNVRSHPVAAWVVADVGGRALAINLAIGEVVPIEAGQSAIVAVAPRRDRDAGAVVVFLDGDALELRLLGGEARPMPRREGSEADAAEPEVADEGPAAAPAPPGSPDGPAARTASLRERLGQRSSTSERVIPPAQAVLAPPSAPSLATGLTDRLGRSVRSIGAGAPPEPAPAPAAPAPVAAPAGPFDVLGPLAEAVVVSAPAPAPARATAPLVAARAGSATGRSRMWRDELVAWCRAPRPPAPSLDGSTLRALATRLALPGAAWPIACLLYGRWLTGGGAHGVASARLVAGSDAGWAEVLHGALVGLGLVTWRHGRACLADAAGDFLDERPPSAVELVGDARRAAAPAGQAQVIGDGAAAARRHAELLAEELGQVALARVGAALDQARLEAWLRGLALIVDGDPGPLALRRDEAVVAIVPLPAP